MSEPRNRQVASPLPAASVDITEMRRAVDAAAATVSGRPQVRTTALSTAGLLVLVAATFAAIAASDPRIAVAVGLVVLLVGTALIFVLPVQLARRRARAAIDEVAATIDDAVSRVVSHLVSIGYAIPDEVALDWVTSSVPAATVPLVHDSVIAARWWRPAEADERVFVEAIVRQDGQDRTLPVLAPLQRT